MANESPSIIKSITKSITTLARKMLEDTILEESRDLAGHLEDPDTIIVAANKRRKSLALPTAGPDVTTTTTLRLLGPEPYIAFVPSSLRAGVKSVFRYVYFYSRAEVHFP